VESIVVIVDNVRVRDRNRHAGGKEKERVHQRQTSGVKHLSSVRGSDSSYSGGRDQAVVEEGSEEGEEEHHFGKDEENHSEA
jgi:hypothetical protein